MLRPVLLLSSLLGLGFACTAQTVAGLQYEGSLSVAQFEAGYLISWDEPYRYHHLTLYRPDAKPAYGAVLNEAGHFYSSWAVDNSGIAARTNNGVRQQKNSIEFLSQSGEVIRTIDTTSYCAERVTFAPDHTLWTVGFEEWYDSQGKDFNVVRHYSQTGELLGQALPWSLIAGNHNAYTALQLILGGRWLFSANDRIGFVAMLNAGSAEWVEVSFSGDLLGHYSLGSHLSRSYEPLAMTSDGNVFALIWEGKSKKGYALLDRSSGTWRNVTGYPEGRLIGSKDDNLVFSHPAGGWTVLNEIPSTALLAETSNPPKITNASQSR